MGNTYHYLLSFLCPPTPSVGIAWCLSLGCVENYIANA